MKRNAEAKQEPVNGKVESFEVQNVRDTKKGVFFTLVLNGVSINNVKVVEGQKGDFLGLPQYKGSDGEYYYTCYFRFSDEDQQAIIDEVEKVLNDK